MKSRGRFRSGEANYPCGSGLKGVAGQYRRANPAITCLQSRDCENEVQNRQGKRISGRSAGLFRMR
ncbi:Hypothetical protein OINT_2000697 [Brucella intermedia LMG 3301]|uniref:Uncharacterized protein n=1 Tax=Brucella intermedia LMG 3301 TaxID=641118 RepID=C4WL06_9HYPH|nr:Hypothetical protein OINT_2000697 [Brucella intermedia LMG 3301]